MKLARILLNFHEISSPYVFSCDEAKQFLNQFKLLQKFQFKLAETESVEVFKETFASGWKILMIDYSRYVEMERI